MRFIRRNCKWKIFATICIGYCLLYLYFVYKRTSHPDSSTDTDSLHCRPKTNFVYIKMIKCASSTLATVFRRFGLANNLSFVLPPKKRIYLGWPFSIQPGFYRPSKTGYFNVLCEHAVYNYEAMSSLMPEDTVYITSLREPFSQFKSMFTYYNLKEISGVPGNSPLTEYLQHVEKYEASYKSHNASKLRYCIPDGFSMTKNLMSFNLGFPTGFPESTPDLSQDGTARWNFLNEIHTRFPLVLIVEYFDESLVMLKRFMCWGLKDILYSSLNVAVHPRGDDEDLSRLSPMYYNWSNVDKLLYDEFLQVFLQKVKQLGTDFRQEVQHFRTINQRVVRFCDSINKTNTITPLVILSSKWNERFTVDINFCDLFSNTELLDLLKQMYDEIPVLYEESEPAQYFC